MGSWSVRRRANGIAGIVHLLPRGFGTSDQAIDVALQLVGGEGGKAKEAVGTMGGACVRGEEAKSG